MTQTSQRLLHITDTHLFTEPAGLQHGINTLKTLSRVLDQALADPRPPDAILATGDISQDETRGAYTNFRKVLAATGLPVWCLPGNHDAPAFMQGELSATPFQLGGALTRDNWCLLMLSSHTAGDHGGRLAQSELQWLSAMLEKHAGHHVLLAIHHHVLPVNSRWLDDLGLYNSDELLAILDHAPQVRGVLSGHVHQAWDEYQQGVRFMTTPSTCYQFVPGLPHFGIDQRPPGFRWLDLLPDGRIDTEVVWVHPQ